jgi:uncharacterized RmlC-like cupin family protein
MTFKTLPARTLLAVLAAALGSGAAAQPHDHGHSVVLPAEMKWVDLPSLPPGAKLAVLEGALGEAAPFTARLRLPANYRIPAHWHPSIERVTVVSGAFYMGTGDSIDISKGVLIPVGGFTAMPAKTPHFAYTLTEPTEIQLHSVGPWGITYLNPIEDPRRKP